MTAPPEPTGLAALKAALDLPKPVVDLGCDLVRDLVGSTPVRIASGMLSDQLYYWKWRNRVRIAHRAAEIIEHDGIARRIVPPSFLLPLLDAAGDIEDPDLQELWARLLASGVAADEHQHPMWIKILAQMSAEDAKAFEDTVAATDREDVPFVLEPARPGWTMVPPDPVDARLHALGLVELVERHDESTPPEQRAGTGTLPWPVARLSGLGDQFRDAVMPGSEPPPP